jgi:hypothetical protein
MTDGPRDPIDAADDELDDPWHDQLLEAADTFGAPEVLALLGLVTGVASFFGFGVMNGTVYVIPFLGTVDGDNSTRVVIGTLVGAALAMVPVWLGWRAVSQALPSDPRWIVTIGRTAVILGLASGLLRLVVAVVEAAHDGPSGFTRL